MGSLEAEYDDAMYAFSTGDFAAAAEGLRRVLAQEGTHFEAQLALGMVLCRLGDYAGAIREGHRAEQLRPQEQLVHTNLSLFYVKAGDKARAEHHGLQARIASWRGNLAPPAPATEADAALRVAPSAEAPAGEPVTFPEQPWKAQPPGGSRPGAASSGGGSV